MQHLPCTYYYNIHHHKINSLSLSLSLSLVPALKSINHHLRLHWYWAHWTAVLPSYCFEPYDWKGYCGQLPGGYGVWACRMLFQQILEASTHTGRAVHTWWINDRPMIKHTCTIIISCAHTHRNFQEIKIYYQYSLTIIYDQFVVLINTIIYCTQCLLYSDK